MSQRRPEGRVAEQPSSQPSWPRPARVAAVGSGRPHARPHTLVVRLDSVGDVLLAGPAIRAAAACSRRVTFLASARGASAARLLPGVDEVVECAAPWIVADPAPVDRVEIEALVAAIADREVDVAMVLTSFHQSPLPTALCLRMAGVGTIGAVSVDYPGSLLDLRHAVVDDIHEVERSLSLAGAMGFSLPAGDDGRLGVRRPLPQVPVTFPAPGRPIVVVHPGASVPARGWSARRHRQLVAELGSRLHPVVVTGSGDERELTAFVASGHPAAVDLGGATEDLAGLAAVIAAAAVVVVGNTGPAHLAAAVGTQVVSLFAPTVPAVRWRPWGVASVLLGAQDIACAGCRARVCPVPGHPCIDRVDTAQVVAAVESLLAAGAEQREPDAAEPGAAADAPASSTPPSRAQNRGGLRCGRGVPA